MKYYFCSYFDHNYLIYGLTLYRSLQKSGIDFIWYIGCLDDLAHQKLLSLADPAIVPVRLSQIEEDDPEFAACRHNRSRVEYIFTLSPVLPLYLFKHFPEIDILTYLDADLYFFGSPQKLYEELGDDNIMIFEHDFPDRFPDHAGLYGKFNVCCQLYRKNEVTLACLKHWRRRCIDCCQDHPGDGLFADQKYLEEWPGRFAQVKIAAKASGAGAAPWNIIHQKLYFTSGGNLLIGQNPLIFYHYQGFKVVTPNIVRHGTAEWGALAADVSDYLHKTYYRELKKTAKIYPRLFDSNNNVFAFADSRIAAGGIEFQPFDFLSHILPSAWVRKLKIAAKLAVGSFLYQGSAKFCIFHGKNIKNRLKK